MDTTTAQRLTELTSDFYTRVGESFSATRGGAWRGWERMLAEVGLAGTEGPLRVLDLACGNLRFERYLAQMLPGRQVAAACVDDCDGMAGAREIPGVEVEYLHCDVVDTLHVGKLLQDMVGCDQYDLAVCFGFMHHLPLVEQRVAVLQALVESARPGAYVAVSFWQLGNCPELAAKARRITAEQSEAHGLEGLGPNDYLLGWQGRTDVLRYCHDFAETELDGLARAVRSQAQEVVRFSADGRTGDLNRYLVFQRA